MLLMAGGEVTIDKTSWWLLDWVWEKDEAKLATIEQTPAELKLWSHRTGKEEVIKRLQPTESIRVLGSMYNLAGEMKEEYKKRRKQLEDIGKN